MIFFIWYMFHLSWFKNCFHILFIVGRSLGRGLCGWGQQLKNSTLFIHWVIYKEWTNIQNYASQLHQCHKKSCNGNRVEKTIKSFKGLQYTHSLSCLSCCVKWLICAICMKRQSNSYMMTAYVERCSSITIKSRETPVINVNTTLLRLYRLINVYTSLW